MFYGRAAGHDALFSLGLEYNEDDDWNSLPSKGGWVRPFLGGQGPKVLVFTILSAKGKGGEVLSYRAIFTRPMGPSVPICTLGPMFSGACDGGYLSSNFKKLPAQVIPLHAGKLL